MLPRQARAVKVISHLNVKYSQTVSAVTLNNTFKCTQAVQSHHQYNVMILITLNIQKKEATSNI